MTDVWLFGTFASSNNNLDPSKTSDRMTAKWRSQVKVPTGHQAFAPFQAGQTNYVIIGTSAATATVKAVYISDLEYQLRNTDPITDEERWIRSVNSGTVGGFQYIAGYRLGTQTEYTGFTYTPSATNPNPAPIVKPTPTPKSLVNLGYLSFAETRLDLGYDYGAVGGMSYGTEITEVVDGREQRNATRYLPLGRWQLGDRLVADSERDLLAEVSYLKQFHLDRLGSFQGFRFKDWSDFKAVNQDIATGNGVKTQFQLRKAYKVGSAVTYRPIQKPVVGTVDILVNGVNVATIANHGWVVDHATGVLSNPTPLANGAKLTANFEFDVPVWFESDEIGFRLEAYEPETEAVAERLVPSEAEVSRSAVIYRLESVYVVEGRIPPAITWDVQKLIEITEELDLGIIYETVEQYQFSTLKQELKSGYAIRESKREESRFLVNLGDRNYDQAEVDQILAYFWNARGSLAEFPFKNLGKSYKVRFDQDQLNFKFEAASDSDKLFNLSALKIHIKEEIILKIPVLPSFILNGITFDISKFEGLTPNHITIESRNYQTLGGGTSNTNAGSGSGGSSGFAASFGYKNISFQNNGAFGVAGYPFIPHLLGDFDGIPFAIGSLRVNSSDNNLHFLCLAYLSNPTTGVFTVNKIGNFYLQMYNQERVKELIFKNGKYITVLAVRDVNNLQYYSMCLEIDSLATFNYTTTLLTSTNLSLSAPNFYVDDEFIHVFTSSGSTYRFIDYLSPSGLIVTETVDTSVVYKSGVNTGSNYVYPVAVSGDSIALQSNTGSTKKVYPGSILGIQGNISSPSIKIRKAIPDPVNDFETIYSIASNQGTVLATVRKPDSAVALKDIIVFDCNLVKDATFPHTNLAKNDAQTRYYIVFKRVGQNGWEILGSWRNSDVSAIGSTNDIFIYAHNRGDLYKGILINDRRWLIDFNTGAINTFNNLIPGFPFTTINAVSASPNYVFIYGSIGSQVALGILGINN